MSSTTSVGCSASMSPEATSDLTTSWAMGLTRPANRRMTSLYLRSIVLTMAECPWCGGPVRDTRAPCPKCGKLSTDLRTTDPPEAPRAGQIATDVPDLVIPSAPVSKPATPRPAAELDDFALGGGADLQIDLADAAPVKPGVAKPPSPGPAAPPPMAPGAFSPFDEDFSSGPSLELDTEGGSLPPRISSPLVSNPPSAPAVPAAQLSISYAQQAP